MTRSGGVRRRLAVLSLPDLRSVFLASVVSNLGDGIVPVALAFAVLERTHSATDLGVIMAARTICSVAMSLVGGVVADRLSRRTVMVGADLLRGAAQASIGILLLVGDASVLEIVVSQVFVAAGRGFFEPASMGMIQATAGEHAQEANALKTIATSGTQLLGPALGGLLVVAVGASWGLIADGLSFGLSAALLLGVSARAAAATARDAEASGFLRELRGGWDEVRRRSWVWATIALMAFGNLFALAFPVLGPFVCKAHYGGAAAYAALDVAWALGMLIGGSAMLSFKPRFPLRVSFLVCIPAMVPLVLLGLHTPIYVIGAAQVLSGVGMTVFNTLWWTALQDHVPPAAISRVSSFDWAGTLALSPIGYVLVGPLAAALGDSRALWICGIAFTLITAAGLLVPGIRNLETPSTRPVAAGEPELAPTGG